MITDSKDKLICFILKNAYQIPQFPFKSKIYRRLVPVSRGPDDFFAGGIHRELVAQQHFV